MLNVENFLIRKSGVRPLELKYIIMLVLYQESRVPCTVGECISGLYSQVRQVSSGVVVHVWKMF